jgi:hypothetical protein
MSDDGVLLPAQAVPRIHRVVRAFETKGPFLGQADIRRVGANAIVLFKITGNATGNEQYNARSVGGPSTQDAATNLVAPPTGMTVATSDDLLVLNIPSSGGAGHSISSGTFGAGKIIGLTSETPARRIVWAFGGGGGSLPTPTALGQGVFVTEFIDGTHYTWAADWDRGHA